MSAWSLPGYTLYSHDQKKARRVADRIAVVDVVLSKILLCKRRDDGIPTRVLLLRDATYRRYLAPSGNIAAEFVSTPFANYLLISTFAAGEYLDHIVDHENTHSFLRDCHIGQLPAWFDEGMATVIDESELLKKSVRLGVPKTLVRTNWLPLDRLLRADKQSKEYLSSHTNMFHVESFLIVHKAMFEQSDFRKKMFAYLAAVNEGLPIDEAAQRGFGMSVDELDGVIREYANRDRINAGRLDFEPPVAQDMSKSIGLTELDGLELLARGMFDTGLNPDRVEEVIATAAKLSPDDARVLVLRLRLAIRHRDDAAVQAISQRLQSMSADAEVARAFGLAMFERVHGELRSEVTLDEAGTAAARLAFEMLERSERALPVSAEAAWAFALLAARLDRETGFAATRLEQARKQTPLHPNLAMASALMYQRLGLGPEMQQQLRNVVRFARTPGDQSWALERLKE